MINTMIMDVFRDDTQLYEHTFLCTHLIGDWVGIAAVIDDIFYCYDYSRVYDKQLGNWQLKIYLSNPISYDEITYNTDTKQLFARTINGKTGNFEEFVEVTAKHRTVIRNGKDIEKTYYFE